MAASAARRGSRSSSPWACDRVGVEVRAAVEAQAAAVGPAQRPRSARRARSPRARSPSGRARDDRRGAGRRAPRPGRPAGRCRCRSTAAPPPRCPPRRARRPARGSGCTSRRTPCDRWPRARMPRPVRREAHLAADRRGERQVVGDGHAVGMATGYSRLVPGAARSSVRHVVAKHGRALRWADLALRRPRWLQRPAGVGSSGWRSSSMVMPRRMLWSALTHSPSSRTSTRRRVLRRHRAGSRRRPRAPCVDDLLRADLGGAGQLALLDEERGLLLGAGEDALGLFLGTLDEPRRLLVDALGLADLLGHGDAQLVDEVERSHLVHDHGVGHGHACGRSRSGPRAVR